MVTNEDIARISEEHKLFGETDWAIGVDTARLINALRNEGLLLYSAEALSMDGDKGIRLYFYHNLPHNAGVEIGSIYPPADNTNMADTLNRWNDKAQDIINFLNKIPNE